MIESNGISAILFLSIVEKTLLNRFYTGKQYDTVRLVYWSSLTASVKQNIQRNISEKVITEKNGYNFLPDLKRFNS